MLENHLLLQKLKQLIAQDLGWGDSSNWTNQDFISLSEAIKSKTNGTLSHVTLKRIWGKVKYNSLPNTYTLNTLAEFAGYQSWREFASKNNIANNRSVKEQNRPSFLLSRGQKKFLVAIGISIFLTSLLIGLFSWISSGSKNVEATDYSFSSKKIITSGLPNTVVFDFDASKAPTDSVVIQQSWDKTMNATISKKEHQYTSIYYLPDFYKAKLVVDKKVVKQHDLFIKSDGWLTAVLLSPVPVYIQQKGVIHDGKMALPVDVIKAQNISLLPKAPMVLYTNVQDFGPVYSDDFIFETALKNDYKGGASVCQATSVYLLCEGTGIGIPLSNKGCVSNLGLLFTNFSASGKKNDLSPFGVDFSSFVKLKIISRKGTAKIFLNDQLVYTVEKDIIKAKIVGINYYFEGTGSVDYVRLRNGKILFEDQF